MAFSGTGKVWMNGKIVDWADAKIHAATHVIHYGSAVFEGARCYKTPKGSAFFRLDAHMRRLYDSARIYRMEYGMDRETLTQGVVDTVKANGLPACYIRPVIYRGYGQLSVNPLPCPVDAMILVWEWGTYLGAGALENGVDVCVSSWARSAPNTFPAMAKSAANYANSSLIKMEALANGYSEGIALDTEGRLSEGSGQNLFLVRDETLYTPPLAASVLPGITRDSIMTLAQDLGFQVREQQIPREMLYLADELFFVGTAAEITPIRSIDKIKVGAGMRGPVTTALQQAFFDYINGVVPDRHGWLSYVSVPTATPEPAAAGLGQ
ncbi:MAG TPA: branched-chain amino acid transaminase [Vicinamibacterales bacterium]|jgi:branched-chain amino acid aminotransferase|nr:branched-chain amino acid transaminase [Vicinamibacterales bacterium]